MIFLPYVQISHYRKRKYNTLSILMPRKTELIRVTCQKNLNLMRQESRFSFFLPRQSLPSTSLALTCRMSQLCD